MAIWALSCTPGSAPPPQMCERVTYFQTPFQATLYESGSHDLVA